MSRRDKPMVELDLILVRQSEGAYLVKDDDEGEKVWLPKSQVVATDPSSLKAGSVVRLEVPEWLAADRGLA